MIVIREQKHLISTQKEFRKDIADVMKILASSLSEALDRCVLTEIEVKNFCEFPPGHCGDFVECLDEGVASIKISFSVGVAKGKS